MASTGTIAVFLGFEGQGNDPPSCFPKFNLDRTDRVLDAAAVPAPQPPVDDLPDPGDLTRTSSGGFTVGRQTLLSMDEIWQNFFAGCQDVAEEGLASGKLQANALESLDPSVILGIPACVVLRAAQRSLSPPEDAPTLGPDDWLMGDGSVISATNRPRNPIADQFFQPVVKLKQDLRKASPDNELWRLLGEAALLQDGSVLEKASETDPPASQLFAGANRLAIMLSRLPTFRRRFGDMTRMALSKHRAGAGTSPAPTAMGAPS